MSLNCEPGTFTVLTNKEVLRGIHPTAQAVYFWLCSYAGVSRNCFPSRTTLASDACCSVRMVDKMLELLVAKGLVTVNSRTNKHGDKDTNLYSVPIMAVSRGVGHRVHDPRAQSAHRTKSSLTKTSNLTFRAAQPLNKAFKAPEPHKTPPKRREASGKLHSIGSLLKSG